MEFTKATDEQLWVIIQNDWDVPIDLMQQLVEEAFNRNLFDFLVKHLINKMFRRDQRLRKYHFSDLYQHGYIGIVRASKNYVPGKGSFKTFAYMNIKTEFAHLLDKEFSQMRAHEKDTVSLNDLRHAEDNDEEFIDSLIDSTRNVEKSAISHLWWQEEFNKLNEREREVLFYFSQGYSLSEMADIYGLKSTVSLHRQMHRAFLKINPNRPNISLKDLGLMTMRKDLIS